MVLLPPSHFTDVEGMFPEDGPNAAMLHATLEGRVPGRVLVDDAQRPSCALVQADYYGFTFPSRPMPPSFLKEGIERLLDDGPVLLVWPGEGDTAAPSVDPPAAGLTLERVMLRGFDVSSKPLHGVQVPEGCMLSPMDSGLVPRCVWHDQLLRAMGSIDRFLTYGLGVCLLRDDTILSEAYMCFWGSGLAEIGVVTHPDHRRQGFGVLTARHLIELCEERGLDVYTTCYAANEPLRRVAVQVGLTEEVPYLLHVYGAASAEDFETIIASEKSQSPDRA
ncbi:MAG: GNAT family N-acetyltransferase [Phycisphaeraceae bacterium]